MSKYVGKGAQWKERGIRIKDREFPDLQTATRRLLLEDKSKELIRVATNDKLKDFIREVSNAGLSGDSSTEAKAS